MMISFNKNDVFYKIKKELLFVYCYFRQIILLHRIKYIKNKIKNKMDKNHVRVCFLLQFPEMWNSLKTVYESMSKDPNFEVKVICVPKIKYHKDRNKSKVFYENNEALVFCRQNNICSINAFDNNKWLDIKQINPDYIIPQRPYDIKMPDLYSLSNLSKIAFVCYIPYSQRLTKGIHLYTEFNYRLLNSSYMIFADCKEAYSYVKNNTLGILLKKYRKIYNIGYPRFDLINSINVSSGRVINFLWTPRWSVSKVNDKSYFFEYFDFIFNYFKEHKDLNLVIRPHPLMFTTFIESGLLTEHDVQEIKEKISKESNISLDKNKDYLISFDWSDAMISDGSSLLYEYALTNKSIAFCGDYESQDYTEEGKRISNTFYIIKNTDDLANYLNNITKGIDEKKELRKTTIKKFHFDKNAGERIKQTLLKDYLDIINNK